MQIKYINKAKRVVTLNCDSLKIVGNLIFMLLNLGYEIKSVKGIECH